MYYWNDDCVTFLIHPSFCFDLLRNILFILLSNVVDSFSALVYPSKKLFDKRHTAFSHSSNSF